MFKNRRSFPLDLNDYLTTSGQSLVSIQKYQDEQEGRTVPQYASLYHSVGRLQFLEDQLPQVAPESLYFRGHYSHGTPIPLL